MKYKFLAHFTLLAGSVAAQGLFCQLVADHATKCENFRTMSSGEIIDLEATKAGFHTLRSSVVHLGTTVVEACGETLTVQTAEFPSPQDAKRFLDWNAKRASKINVQGSKTDSKGRQVGYRAELLLRINDKDLAAIMSTSGPTFRAILAPSFTSAKVLEERCGN